MARIRILVVDDELIVRESLVGWLKKTGYDVDAASGGVEALSRLNETEYDLVFLDIKMPDMSGIEVLKRIREVSPETMVVMITAFGSVDTAVEAMKLGAHDYLMKPFEPEHLLLLVEKLLQQKRIIEENIVLREQISRRIQYEDLIGAAPCMQKLFEVIEEVASVDSPVLIRGETGTGKELVAKAIHAKSPRRYGPFIAINCGAFSESLLESELFGHEAGAFTGAIKTRKGRLELADGGTLFLDEIGEIPLKMQVDLLRVLEEKRFQRVGGRSYINVDFRCISATNRNLEEEIRRGNFRKDLYFRLNVIDIEVPPLRERKEDISLLAEHFLARFRRETNKPVTAISRDAIQLLESYDWPGNVRELENAIERAVVLARGRMLTRQDFDFLLRGGEFRNEADQSLKAVEKRHIEKVLKECGWNISKAARILDINRTTLHHKIKKYGLTPPE
ncbi:sigma-54-dependent transcriptional regulator [Thermodesulforhabdus norvegica]|uniref:Two component, sigma54 specific, transcriptional regulator, Fis family n=1 Tax=Thermodesulforhabdus norvegica TaxID=39841 RepID=A0A1I4SJB8_9BACT|nr:sigma-54 dependent transcriptional regulator [Thermodesulforhabdus norvegica]SFM64451.1 two component, sigma54 specific, transcriptional regulator, Fis family [Thermodesulforhabdus norvegica]